MLFINLTANSSLALQVEFKTGDYSSDWQLQGRSSKYRGDKTLDLEPGIYQVNIAAIGFFNFILGSNGMVSVQNSSAASGDLNSLSLENQSIKINKGKYEGKWVLLGVNSFTSDSETLVLVPGVKYRFAAGGVGVFDAFLDDGAILQAENGTSIITDVGSVTLNAHKVIINPQRFLGTWAIAFVTDQRLKGRQELFLVAGLRYQIAIGSSSLVFKINNFNEIEIDRPSIAQAYGNELLFHNREIQIQANGFKSDWMIAHTTSYLSGDNSLVLIPDLEYVFFIAGGSSANFKFTFNQAHLSKGQPNISGDMDKLIFNTAHVNIKPYGDMGIVTLTGLSMRLPVYNNLNESQVTLIANLEYHLRTNESEFSLKVGASCDDIEELSVGQSMKITFNCVPVNVDPVTQIRVTSLIAHVESHLRTSFCMSLPEFNKKSLVCSKKIRNLIKKAKKCLSEPARNRGQYVSCVRRSITAAVKAKSISKKEAQAVFKFLVYVSRDYKLTKLK